MQGLFLEYRWCARHILDSEEDTVVVQSPRLLKTFLEGGLLGGEPGSLRPSKEKGRRGIGRRGIGRSARVGGLLVSRSLPRNGPFPSPVISAKRYCCLGGWVGWLLFFVLFCFVF